MKTKCSLLLSLILMFAAPAFASEASHREAAKQMVEVANLDKMLNAMYEEINSVIIQNLLARDPCLEPIKQSLTDLLVKYDQRILNATVVKGEIEKVYVQEFTEDEIKEIVAFYKTPAGKKALEKAPLLAAKGMEIAQKEMEKSREQGVMTELQNEITKLIDNIDVSKLSSECKKQFEERKANKAKADAASKAGAAPSDKPASEKPVNGKAIDNGKISTTTDKASEKKPSEKAK